MSRPDLWSWLSELGYGARKRLADLGHAARLLLKLCT
jgi:hypothetical protein